MACLLWPPRGARSIVIDEDGALEIVIGDRRVYVHVGDGARERFARLERAHTSGERAGFGEYVAIEPGGAAPDWLPRPGSDVDELMRACAARGGGAAVVRKLAAIAGEARGRRFGVAELPATIRRIGARLAAFPAAGRFDAAWPEASSSARVRVIGGERGARREWAAEAATRIADDAIWIEGDAAASAASAIAGAWRAGTTAFEALRAIDAEIDRPPILFVDRPNDLSAIEGTRRIRWVVLVDDGKGIAARLGVKEERLSSEIVIDAGGEVDHPAAGSVDRPVDHPAHPFADRFFGPPPRSATPVVRASGQSGSQVHETTGRRRSKSVPRNPRNARCPCGSGLKYKKCHGR